MEHDMTSRNTSKCKEKFFDQIRVGEVGRWHKVAIKMFPEQQCRSAFEAHLCLVGAQEELSGVWHAIS